jgi:drug/metabolite transporter (DMT)-like permease
VRRWRRCSADSLVDVTIGRELLAVTILSMAPVAALRESNVLFSAVIGTVTFREGIGPRRIAAAALVTSGIVVLGVMR